MPAPVKNRQRKKNHAVHEAAVASVARMYRPSVIRKSFFRPKRCAYARFVGRCRLLGHRFRFRAEGTTMRWECERGCGAGGLKEYATADEASRYAAAFDREDSAELGRRAPLLGMFPLRLWWFLRRRR